MRAPSFGGLTVAALCLAASLTPSLLPRHWTFQAVVVGVVTAAGYGLGTLAVTSVRGFVPRRPAPAVARVMWQVVLVVGLVGLALLTDRVIHWQQDLHRLMGLPAPSGSSYVLAIAVGLALAVGLVAVGRGVAGWKAAPVVCLPDGCPRAWRPCSG